VTYVPVLVPSFENLPYTNVCRRTGQLGDLRDDNFNANKLSQTLAAWEGNDALDTAIYQLHSNIVGASSFGENIIDAYFNAALGDLQPNNPVRFYFILSARQ
jgi:hypothetical protein